MAGKRKKTQGIPLSDLVRDEVGIRNALMFMGENNSDPKLRRALARELVPIATRGVRFAPGRPAGSKSDKVQHIHKLARKNPDLSAKRLYALADKSIIGDMAEGTFSNHAAVHERA